MAFTVVSRSAAPFFKGAGFDFEVAPMERRRNRLQRLHGTSRYCSIGIDLSKIAVPPAR
jgi:hypothetical protein